MTIKDHEICGDFGAGGASCFHTLSDESRDLSKIDWDNERFGQLCMKPEVFADWKKVISQLCNLEKRCTYEQKEALRKFEEKLTNLFGND